MTLSPKPGESPAKPRLPPIPPPSDDRPEDHEPEPLLSPGLRIGLYVLGWLLVLIGTAGLVLPGIQGIVTILAGVVVLSLVSRTVHRWSRRGLSRWPHLLERYERMREKATRRFGRKGGGGGDGSGAGDRGPG